MTYLDLLQVYNIKNGNDLNDVVSIFRGIDIDERVDIETMALTILDECGAMRCIYDTSPTFKMFSDNFFRKYKESISRILDALEAKYKPLESMNVNWTEGTNISQNLDTDENVQEDREKHNTGTQTTTNTGTSTTNNTGTQNDNGSGTEDNTISAMNENTYQPDSHRTTSSNNTRTDNLSEQRIDNLAEEMADNRKESINSNNNRNKNEQLTWEETDTHTERGNKNYPYQDLIDKEIKIREHSIYGWISRKYANELFLLVY